MTAHVEHRPGLRTDACRLCSRHRRPPRRLTLCVGCPEAVRRVHLELHVCPPLAAALLRANVGAAEQRQEAIA